jgi:exopolysaccharide biosynthesis polyprenyl glycosylphosphotransferase
MLHLLRHYLPLRKVLLIASETVLLTMVITVGMSAHLWAVTDVVRRLIAQQDLSVDEARWRCLVSALMVSVLAQLTLSINELYDFRISGSRHDRASRFLGSAGSAIVIVIALVALMHIWSVERVLDFPGLSLANRVAVLTFTMVVAFTLLYFWRNLFHFWIRRTDFNERVLILGSSRISRRLVDELLSRPDSGFEIVGMLQQGPVQGDRRRLERRRVPRAGERDPGDEGTGNPWYEAALPGRTRSLAARAAAEGAAAQPNGGSAATATRLVTPEPEASASAEELGDEIAEPISDLARRLSIDDVIVAFEERRGSLPTQELLRCRLRGIVVEEAESFYERLTGKIPAEAMRPSYLIFNQGFVQHPLAEAAKRGLDVVLALVGILLSWPIMLVAASMIRLDSPGPILFRQERTGRHGRSFTLLKFRSMRPDAEKETGPVWASQNDPRITRVGHFLRKTRIDELPQLFNVLMGSMSVVGPRPERPAFVEQLVEKIPYFQLRHIAKPGITGWAQINYPYANTLEDALQKLQYDLFYIKYQSLIFDLSILFNTVKTVVLRKGT